MSELTLSSQITTIENGALSLAIALLRRFFTPLHAPPYSN
jgi:hypothetical protein